MFGYIRPMKGELKVKDYELFKSAYCGLCNTLKKRYGYSARFLINYDFTFLAMLLSSGKQKCEFEYRRCSASPLRKKCACISDDSFELCADYSVILYYWKLRDSFSDGGFREKFLSASALLFLSHAYKKAAKSAPQFDERVKLRLKELSLLEKSGCTSIDETADKFADILSAAAETREDSPKKRALSQLLYHIGRQIYVLDAIDDIESDFKAGLYNAVAARYDIKDGKIPEKIKNELRTTLSNSRTLSATAYELLPIGMWSPILSNIEYLGTEWIAETVLTSSWRRERNKKEK